MHPRFLLLLASTVGLNSSAVFAAPSGNLDQEYDQVRRIALRDPKVKAAFENANQRLESKIIEIDPALKGYVKGRTDATPAVSSQPAEATALRKPFVKPSKASVSAGRGGTHVIITGDTLSSIATRYKVTVADLKVANPSVNEKKLQVGDKLIVPLPHPRLTKTEPVKTSAWERLKSNF